MGKKLLTAFFVLLLFSSGAYSEHIGIRNSDQDVGVSVLKSDDQSTVVRFNINGFNREEVEINGEIYNLISCGDENSPLIKGAPALPRICRSIIIPNDAHMSIRVLDSKSLDYKDIRVAPSKGSISRTLNPSEVPYTFGEAYQSSDFYPMETAGLRTPFIQRDFRGIEMEIYPFQYQHQTKTLRVYTTITVEIYNDGPGLENVFKKEMAKNRIANEFENIYRDRFINYNANRNKYPSVPEIGDMLIITYDSFHDAMMPLVEWKRQKGIRTDIVDVSTIGNNDTYIKNFISNYYDTTNLCFVLLVGDGAQIDVPYSNGDSDPSYGKLVGTDNYPEILVGRFSAENVAQVETQVTRSIGYEKTPFGSDWYQKGIGVGSNQGPGDDNEYDNEHLNNIRTLLLNYGFTEVDQIYDPSATATAVAAAFNNGRSVSNYTGHGSVTSWSSSGFSNSHVNNLTNDWMLPTIFSVACVNGDFNGNTCFAEAWLRATNGDNPTGAIATYMSTINQDWDEPMEAQDAFNDLLVGEEKATIGGLFVNAGCRMLETYGSAGVDDFDTWTVFGDPSVPIRVKNPETMTVSYSSAHIFTLTDFDVDVTGVENALCALYQDGVLFGSAFTNAAGHATIPISGDLPIGQTVTLTVTAQHKTPYIGEVQIIAPEGPFVVFDGFDIEDVMGNNDGVANCGESVSMALALSNVGPDTAYNVSAVISTTDTFITVTDNSETFGMIPGDFEVTEISGAFAYEISSDMPNDHAIEFTLEITGSDTRDTTWTSNFTVEGHCYPMMSSTPGSFSDSLSLNETTVDSITFYNDGNAELNIDFSCLDSWLDFASGTQIVAPHDSMVFEVLVGGPSISYGDHYCSLDYTSNDPDNSFGSFDFAVHIYSPDIYFEETSIGAECPVDDIASVPFSIMNNGQGRLDYNITRLMFNGKNTAVAKTTEISPLGYRPADAEKSTDGTNEPFFAPTDKNSGGPDAWGYNWVDSDDPSGPVFEWVDISSVGTAVALGDDDATGAIPIGFSFPFYENYYSEIYIGSNGIITFGTSSSVRTNQMMPVTQVPNNMISIWWDDLDPEESGAIYYYYDAANERFIVSFDGVPNYANPTGTGSLSFQAILLPNGHIKLQYGTMDPGEDAYGLESASIGIENAAGDDGLTVVYNAAYMHANLAIYFAAAQWLSVDPGSGSINGNSSANINVNFDTEGMSEGSYSGQLNISSNDPDLPMQSIPVSLEVVTEITYICGDFNGDDQVNIIDITSLIAYLYQDGAAPAVLNAVDTNGDGLINVIDITTLINHIYYAGLVNCP